MSSPGITPGLPEILNSVLPLLPTASPSYISFAPITRILQECRAFAATDPFVVLAASFIFTSFSPGLNANAQQSLLFMTSNQFPNCLLVTLIKEMPLPRLSGAREMSSMQSRHIPSLGVQAQVAPGDSP